MHAGIWWAATPGSWGVRDFPFWDATEQWATSCEKFLVLCFLLALTCWSCHNKTLPTKWLKQQKWTFSCFWRQKVYDLPSWLVDGCLFTWPHVVFSLCAWAVPGNLNILFRGPVSKHSHILWHFSVDLSVCEFAGDEVSPLHPPRLLLSLRLCDMCYEKRN